MAYSGIDSVLHKLGHTMYDPATIFAELAMQSGVTPGEFTSWRAFCDFVRNVPQFQVYLAMLGGQQNVSMIHTSRVYYSIASATAPFKGRAKKTTPPGHTELPVDDQVDVSIACMMLLSFVKSEEDDGNDDASPTALGLTADGSNATTASTTALDRSVDGSDAPPASTTALGLPANGSNLPEEGDAMDAGSIGNEVGPIGDGATAAFSIPPV